MTTEPPTQVWGTAHWPDDGDGTARHAVPVEQPAADPQTSYGELFEHPPYATEDGPMTVELPAERSAPVPSPQPGPPAAEHAGPELSTLEMVTCPECGSTQQVHLNRRESSDFCRRCDFPLFWTPARVTRDWNPTGAGEALRRLPGTGGSTRLASSACPHCSELNAVSAQTCIRCGRSMQIVAPPPAPAPYIPPPPPPPVYEPEPEPSVAWWVWVLLGVIFVGAVFAALYFTGVFD